MSSVLFTPDKDQIIRDHYPTEGKNLCEMLGVTQSQLGIRAWRLGVKRIPVRDRPETKERREQQNLVIREKYPEFGPDKVAEILGLTRNSVITMASRLGVIYENQWADMVNTKAKNSKTVNVGYFQGGVTDNMAYILGYVWADGCVRQHNCEKGPNIFKLCCHPVDRDILENVTRELGITREIKYTPPYIDSKGRKQGNHLSVYISNYLFVKPLVERFGIIPRKSYNDCYFPDYIPEDKWSHFCRGHFDGDGGFHRRNRRLSDNGHGVHWCGTDLFMEGLRNLLVQILGVRECAIVVQKQSKTGLLRVLQWTSVEDFLIIGNFLYPPGNNYLYGNRKRMYFEKAKRLMTSSHDWDAFAPDEYFPRG